MELLVIISHTTPTFLDCLYFSVDNLVIYRTEKSIIRMHSEKPILLMHENLTCSAHSFVLMWFSSSHSFFCSCLNTIQWSGATILFRFQKSIFSVHFGKAVVHFNELIKSKLIIQFHRLTFLFMIISNESFQKSFDYVL